MAEDGLTGAVILFIGCSSSLDTDFLVSATIYYTSAFISRLDGYAVYFKFHRLGVRRSAPSSSEMRLLDLKGTLLRCVGQTYVFRKWSQMLGKLSGLSWVTDCSGARPELGSGKLSGQPSAFVLHVVLHFLLPGFLPLLVTCVLTLWRIKFDTDVKVFLESKKMVRTEGGRCIVPA